ncbi:NAD(P)/FAD-dependent oxidoreductase [Actinophytocola oryzae]|uniref:NADH:ubiquinone reductase (non-electrogenic) n=1 Tax=Actinophytocola oryzae TaxID=502181 RepID=A0A4R7VKG4_9PSEU|nr:NAD(P)/FAD-dependent oxidoreductase [Actinophytocola oryzae]TDV49952.1 NADH dehydrogenase [Actinophytocola oryzae]
MRNLATGAITGVLCAAPIMALQGMAHPWSGVYALGAGVVVAAVSGRGRTNAAVVASGGVLIGVLGWLLVPLTLEPLLRGDLPTWSAAAVLRTYPVLVADVLHGGLTGFLLALLPAANRDPRPARPERELARIVIVGGGFAGVNAAKRFERLAVRGVPLDVTLISDSNFLLFTPMLAEVASGALEPTHISAPVRPAVSHTRFRNGRVRKFDAEARVVHLGDELVPYDHLVLAVGSVPHSFNLPGVSDHAWTLKNLTDATRLRNHVVRQLETADNEPNPTQRRRLLTFVVAGAGFAGTETIAELFDLVHRVAHYFPGIGPDEPLFVLVHSGDRILPEMSPELAGYALERLRARGIRCQLDTRVTAATADGVTLNDGSSVTTNTFVWTAGNRPSPLVGHDALDTDSCLRAVGMENVWAVGDCARIPDPDGTHYPPTAQHALRQGRAVADNIAAVLRGRDPVEFRFRTLGMLVALGHRTAIADIRGRRFSGLAAWLLWRGIYLAKLPGLDKRIRVLIDWLLDLVFPRDIVVTSPDGVKR